MLTDDHDRNVHILQNALVIRREDAREKNDAFDVVMAQQFEVFDFLAGVVCGRCEDELVALLGEDLRNAVRHAGDALARQPRDDDADLSAAAGPKCLRLNVRCVARLGDGAFDGRALLLAEVSVVEIAADSRLGDARERRNVGNVHVFSFPQHENGFIFAA